MRDRGDKIILQAHLSLRHLELGPRSQQAARLKQRPGGVGEPVCQRPMKFRVLRSAEADKHEGAFRPARHNDRQSHDVRALQPIRAGVDTGHAFDGLISRQDLTRQRFSPGNVRLRAPPRPAARGIGNFQVAAAWIKHIERHVVVHEVRAHLRQQLTERVLPVAVQAGRARSEWRVARVEGSSFM